jgi:hypothetical protein
MGMTPPHVILYTLIEEENRCNDMEIYLFRGECPRRRMSDTHAATEDHNKPGQYEIRIKGHLADRWADWFEGLTITLEEDGVTLLTGPVVDQAALHSLLRKVRDLGVPLLSVNRVEPGPSTTLPSASLGTRRRRAVPAFRGSEAGQADTSDVK